jgi:hypothetical protein
MSMSRLRRRAASFHRKEAPGSMRYDASMTVRAIALGLAIGVGACSPTTANTVAMPASARTQTVADAAIAEAVRAYLRTFKLEERSLAAGLSIPWVGGGEWGVAKPTGVLGPGGHQTYEIRRMLWVSGGVVEERGSMEIAPEAEKEASSR